MNEILTMVLIGYGMLFLLQTLLWLEQSVSKNATTADIGWSFGMMLLVGWYVLNLDGYWLRELLVFSLIAIWSARLSIYLLKRTINEKREDSRYARFREKWGANANRKFFYVYQLQSIFNVVLSIPFIIILANKTPQIHVVEMVGIILWIVGFLGESLADWQLNHFKQDPQNKGKICQEGLWRYSRHPNFFFEWFIWVAYAVFALGSPNGLWGMIAPAFMLFLLMKVTGIPVIEQYALKKKGEQFREYMRTTSFFVPLPRKV